MPIQAHWHCLLALILITDVFDTILFLLSHRLVLPLNLQQQTDTQENIIECYDRINEGFIASRAKHSIASLPDATIAPKTILMLIACSDYTSNMHAHYCFKLTLYLHLPTFSCVKLANMHFFFFSSHTISP